jgi:hypothetical protein
MCFAEYYGLLNELAYFQRKKKRSLICEVKMIGA